MRRGFGGGEAFYNLLVQPDFGGYRLPQSFDNRFIAGRTLTFLPLFGTVALAVARHRTAWSLPIVVQRIAGLLFISWLAWRRAKIERPELERYANENAAWLRGLNIGKAKTDFLPACVGALLAGGIMAAVKHDVRWLVLGLLSTALIAFGLLLRWLVYDRWLDRLLSEWRSD